MDLVIWYLDPHGPDDAGAYATSLRLMLEAGVSIPDCAKYFGASEAAVRYLLGESSRGARP
jgi:hypothetical protein